MRHRTALITAAAIGLAACGNGPSSETTTQTPAAAEAGSNTVQLDCGSDKYISGSVADGFPSRGPARNSKIGALRAHVAEAAPGLLSKVPSDTNRRENDNGFSFPDQPPPQAQQHNMAQYRAGGQLKAYFVLEQQGDIFVVGQSEQCDSLSPSGNGDKTPETVPVPPESSTSTTVVSG